MLLSHLKLSRQVRAIALVLMACSFVQCASDSTTSPNTDPTVTTNSVYFDSLYTNVSVSSGASSGYWSISTTLPGTIPVIFRFAAKPVAGTYTLLTSEQALTSSNCMFFVNWLDGVNSTTYFPSSTNTKTAEVKIVGGKVNVIIDGVEVTGDRGGKERAPVKANLLEK